MFLKTMMDYIWDVPKQSKSLQPQPNHTNQQSPNFFNLPSNKPHLTKTTKNIHNSTNFFNLTNPNNNPNPNNNTTNQIIINSRTRPNFNFMHNKSQSNMGNHGLPNQDRPNTWSQDRFFMKDEQQINEMKLQQTKQLQIKQQQIKEQQYQQKMYIKYQQANNHNLLHQNDSSISHQSYFENQQQIMDDQHQQIMDDQHQQIMDSKSESEPRQRNHSSQNRQRIRQSNRQRPSQINRQKPTYNNRFKYKMKFKESDPDQYDDNQDSEHDDQFHQQSQFEDQEEFNNHNDFEDQGMKVLDLMKNKLEMKRQQQQKVVELEEKDESNDEFMKCTKQEIREREESYQLDIFEQDPRSDQKVAYNLFCIKKYKRPVPNEETVPALSLNRLQMIMEYIIDHIIDYDREGPKKYVYKKSMQNPVMVDIYNFVSDRFRSVYKDLTISKVSGNSNQIWILERISRFMILCINEMRDYEQYDVFRNSTKLTEYLANLIENYKTNSKSNNYIEFIGYNLVLLIRQPLQLYSLLVEYQQNQYNEIINNDYIQEVLQIIQCIQHNNYEKYFEMLRKNEKYLLVCCMSYYLKEMRIEAIKCLKQIRNLRLEEIKEFLLFDDVEQLCQFLEVYGVTIGEVDGDYVVEKWKVDDQDGQFQRLKIYREPKSLFIESKKTDMTRKQILVQNPKSSSNQSYSQKQQSEGQIVLSGNIQINSYRKQSGFSFSSKILTSQKHKSQVQTPFSSKQQSQSKDLDPDRDRDDEKEKEQEEDELFKPSKNMEMFMNSNKKIEINQQHFNLSEISKNENITIDQNVVSDVQSDNNQQQKDIHQQINDLIEKSIKSSQGKVSAPKSSLEQVSLPKSSHRQKQKVRIKQFIMKQKFQKLKMYCQKKKQKSKSKVNQVLSNDVLNYLRKNQKQQKLAFSIQNQGIQDILKSMKSFKVLILVNSIEKEYDYFVFYLLKLLTNNRVNKDCLSDLPQIYNEFTDKDIKLNLQLFYQKLKKVKESQNKFELTLNDYYKKITEKHLFGSDKVIFILTQNIDLDKQRLWQFMQQVGELKDKYDEIVEQEIKVEMIFIQLRNQYQKEDSLVHGELVEQLDLKEFNDVLASYEFIDYDYYNQYNQNTIYDMDCRKNVFEQKLCYSLRNYKKSHNYQLGYNIVTLQQIFKEIHGIYDQSGLSEQQKLNYYFCKDLYENILHNIIDGVIAVFQNQNRVIYQFMKVQDLQKYHSFIAEFNSIIHVFQNCLLDCFDSHIQNEQDQVNCFDQWRQCNQQVLLDALHVQLKRFSKYDRSKVEHQFKEVIEQNIRFYSGKIIGKWQNVIGFIIEIIVSVVPDYYIFIKDDFEFNIDIQEIYQNSLLQTQKKKKMISFESGLQTTHKVQKLNFIAQTFQSKQEQMKSISIKENPSPKNSILFFKNLEFLDRLQKKIKF